MSVLSVVKSALQRSTAGTFYSDTRLHMQRMLQMDSLAQIALQNVLRRPATPASCPKSNVIMVGPANVAKGKALNV